MQRMFEMWKHENNSLSWHSVDSKALSLEAKEYKIILEGFPERLGESFMATKSCSVSEEREHFKIG